MLNPGFNISQHRSRKGWTQAELAAKVGIAQANLSNIEKGKRDLNVATLVRVAAALEVSPAQLIEEGPSPQKLSLTRTQIETLAKAVVDPKMKVPSNLQELAGSFRVILPGAHPRVSSKKIQQAWTGLRQNFTSREIRGIFQRIEDARQRAYAQKTN